MVEIAKTHHAVADWRGAIARIQSELARCGAHPSRTVVLLPYAQLMTEAKAAWKEQAVNQAEAYFLPRFETTQNWASSLGSYSAAPHDLRLDAAIDLLTAARLLAGAGLGEHAKLLAPCLMEAAWGLAHVVASVPPEGRAVWALQASKVLNSGIDFGSGFGFGFGSEADVLAIEVAIGRIALAWAANSSYITDRLFAQKPELLLVLEGFLAEPLADALKINLGDRGIGFALQGDSKVVSTGALAGLSVYSLADAESEAQMAAACVLTHLNAGRTPVGLVALDRLLTRRIRAMLGEQGVTVRDETGWKLSTTRAAATVMALLRACQNNASSDQVLDWLKDAPIFAGRTLLDLEVFLRRVSVRNWRQLDPRKISGAVKGQAMARATANTASEETEESVAAAESATCAPSPIDTFIKQVDSLRANLVHPRSLVQWISELREALQSAGHWALLSEDNAGLAVLKALRLADDANELDSFSGAITANDFIDWVGQTLEAASFIPTHPDTHQVVILPLSQLLGRALPAVVLPGCDEQNLTLAPQVAGAWTRKQREGLGLASPEELAGVTRKAWQYALMSPRLDLLHRTSENGERLMPSALIQLHLLQGVVPSAADPRIRRDFEFQPSSMPRPQGLKLPVTRLSSSAYEDMRRCPYRFFALRQLKLAETQELETDLSKRDFGNWLHGTLKRFHDALLLHTTPDFALRQILLDVSADQSMVELGFSKAEFLPFTAGWPRLRDGYLRWLSGHEATGQLYARGEVWLEIAMGELTLVGKIDRIDRMPDGMAMVIDYKTENATTTAKRIRVDSEDIQLAFYAALLSDDTLTGSYVNVGEKEITKTYEQLAIVSQRDQLVDGILSDMARLTRGAELPAMGEGSACNFCAARGLCRKDFWVPA